LLLVLVATSGCGMRDIIEYPQEEALWLGA
jgi:hypothetical protein